MRRRWHDHQHRGRASRHRGEVREGVIQLHGHFGFLLAEKEGQSDVFIRGRNLSLVMDGDRVSARVYREENDRYAGEIVEVISRARTSVTGILKQYPKGWVLVPETEGIPPAQVISFDTGVCPKAGLLAALKVTCWPTEASGAAGIVTEIIGDPDDTRARITTVLMSRDIRERFPAEVLSQSAALPSALDPSMWRGREELFSLPVFTIDGADARDFDDAVSLEHLENGLVRLGVHIADVSHYVKPGTALDKEAFRRATSVYLPDRVVPMLPPSLSNNLCSLVPCRERLTLSVFMDIDKEGKVIRRRMADTVIRSCRRFTYEEVQSILDGSRPAGVPAPTARSVLKMGELTDILYGRRVKRGALDFNLPEYKVEVDGLGKPLRVALRPRLKSHRLVEEFMLLANEAVATELMAARVPFLHRRHDVPDPEKISTLAKALGDMGLSAGHIRHGNTHKALQDVIRQADGHPLESLINSMMVRSMKQAVYSPESEGHFGIAARAYAHFTSPIRRYPDLMAHRAVKALLRGEKESHGRLSLAEAGRHCSEKERAAAEAEYKSVDIMRAELFKDRIGMEMDGTVTSVTNRGSFVLCGDTGAEAMLRVTNLSPGTKVRIVIETVDTIEGKIDVTLAGSSSPLPARPRVTSLRKSRRHRKDRA